MSNFDAQTRRLSARKASEQVTLVITSVRRLTLKIDCFYRQTKNLPHCRFQCTTCQRGFDLKTRCQVQTKAAKHRYHELTSKQSLTGTTVISCVFQSVVLVTGTCVPALDTG